MGSCCGAGGDARAPRGFLHLRERIGVISIACDRVCLDYPLFDEVRGHSLKDHLARLLSRLPQRSMFRALHNVSFSLEQGDRVALIGDNGSGKSTLLRVLAGIYPPSEGRVTVSGRIGALFDTVTGIHPNLTGYENIEIRARILGLGRRDVKALVPEITAFCELGEFMARPVRTYSTGMRLRLGFAISTAIRPQVLLIDEVIGVGDIHFRSKARQRLLELVEKSGILVFASHSPELLRQHCTKGLLLAHGRIDAFGPIEKVLDPYTQAKAAMVARASSRVGR